MGGLTAKAVEAARPQERPYKLADAAGLYLFVSPAGGKSWRANYQRAGKQATRTYGRWPDVSLADARRAHAAARDAAEAQALAPRVPSFEEVARAWLKLKLPTLSNGKHQVQVANTLERFVFPALGPRPIDTLRRAALVAHDAKYGKLDTRSFGEFSDMLNKVQSEGYERALRLAQSGAGVAEIAKAFNASGKVQLDPAAIVSDKMVKGKDGVETRVLQFKDQNGDIRTINTVAELDALGKAGEVFSRFYQAEGNRRGNEQLQLSRNADSRAGANQGEAQAARAEAKTEKRDKADSAVALFKDKHPNASDAEINAVRTGIMKAVPETDGNAPSQVKLARAALEARVPGVTDMASALNWAKTNNDKSRDAVRADMYGKALAANMGNAEAAKTATESAMEYLRKASESDSGTGKATPGRSASGKVLQVPQNVTPEDIASTARKYGVSEDEVRRRLGLK